MGIHRTLNNGNTNSVTKLEQSIGGLLEEAKKKSRPVTAKIKGRRFQSRVSDTDRDEKSSNFKSFRMKSKINHFLNPGTVVEIQPKYYKIQSSVDGEEAKPESKSPTERENDKKEKQLNQIKFVIVEKKEYEEYRKLKDLREQTRGIMISQNLGETNATKFIKKVNSGKNLLY